MKNSRAPLVLALSLGIVAVLAVLYLLDRRLQEPEPTVGRNRVQASAGGETEPTGTLKSSSRLHIAKLVERFGGFTSRGRVLLTLPGGPGAKLVVRLRGEVAGETVEAEGLSAEDGRFRLPTLPRAGHYTVAVEGRRAQPFAKAGIVPPGEGELHLGNLVVDRYYFVAGRVVGESKGTVAGAKVALIDPTGDRSFSFFQASVEASRGEPTIAESVVGADGRFRMRLDQPGIVTLRARADGWAPHYRRNLIVGGAADVRVQVALTPGHLVVGYVLDAAGHASADAAVVFYGTGYGSFGAAKEVTHTDEAGKFSFRVEPSTRDYMLSVVPERGLDLNTRFKVPLDEDLVLRMPGHGAVIGRVVDGRNNQPLGGADVLVGISTSSNAMRMPDYTKAVRTNSKGVFRIEGVGKGRISRLSVRAVGFGDLRLNAFQPTDAGLWRAVKGLTLTGESEQKLPPLALLPGKELCGTIRDELTNRPLPGAVVELWDFIMGSFPSSGMRRFATPPCPVWHSPGDRWRRGTSRWSWAEPWRARCGPRAARRCRARSCGCCRPIAVSARGARRSACATSGRTPGRAGTTGCPACPPCACTSRRPRPASTEARARNRKSGRARRSRVWKSRCRGVRASRGSS